MMAFISLSSKLARAETQYGPRLMYWCPACNAPHQVTIERNTQTPNGRPIWNWDDDVARPTFAPSILVTSSNPAVVPRCHHFVRSGRIEYCGDSSHAMAGQTVDLPDIPPEWL